MLVIMEELNKSSNKKDTESEASSGDSSIPKMNMRFDGQNWISKNTVDQNEDDKNEVFSSSAVGAVTVNTSGEQLAAADDSQADRSSSASNDDHEFDYEADAGDYDDEETIDEEEADEDGEGDEEELDDLAKEGEMPLNDLLARYYSKPNNLNAENEKASDNDNEDNEENRNESENEEDTRKLRSTASFLSPPRPDSGDEENDRDYVPPAPDDWKKTPRVGEEYQVNLIPDKELQVPDYDDSTDQLVWNPLAIDSDKVVRYLSTVGGMASQDTTSLIIPAGSHLRDNEDALFLLTQCDNDVDEAIRRYKWKPQQLTSELAVWSEDECRQFEQGLSVFGKDFFNIHRHKVKTKSIGEIVKFYYIWKKSERYDNFSAKTRLGKKKDILHPGVTDYMERLLDETEHSIAQQGSHANVSSSSFPPPLSHSAALQQHLVDLRVMRRPNRQQNHIGAADSPVNEYAEMNGLSDADYADDMETFDCIVPTLPANHIYPPVPFSSMDPRIVVGYSHHGHIAPVSTTSHQSGAVSVNPVTANRNNNCHVTSPATGSFGDAPDFRPLAPVDITPGFDSAPPSDVAKTPSLPPDVLSSIDELENVYCGSSSGSTSTTHTPPQSSQLDTMSVDSPLEVREALSLKRFHSSSNADKEETKRRKTGESQVPHPTRDNPASLAASPPNSSNDEVMNKDPPHSSSDFQTASESELKHEAISGAPRIASC